MADDGIELGNAADVLALRLKWETELNQRGSTLAPPFDVTTARKERSERMHADYAASTLIRAEKRAKFNTVETRRENQEARRAWAAQNEPSKPRKLSKSDERWNKIFEEKHEDKSYYGVRASIGSSCSGLDELPADDGTGHPATVRR